LERPISAFTPILLLLVITFTAFLQLAGLSNRIWSGTLVNRWHSHLQDMGHLLVTFADQVQGVCKQALASHIASCQIAASSQGRNSLEQRPKNLKKLPLCQHLVSDCRLLHHFLLCAGSIWQHPPPHGSAPPVHPQWASGRRDSVSSAAAASSRSRHTCNRQVGWYAIHAAVETETSSKRPSFPTS
jgi:hypothetical protein